MLRRCMFEACPEARDDRALLTGEKHGAEGEPASRKVKRGLTQHIWGEPSNRSGHIGQFTGIPEVLPPSPAVPQVHELDVLHHIQNVGNGSIWMAAIAV